MAVIGSRFLTMADVAKSKNKQIGKVAEVLVRQNPMLNDIPYQMMNDGTIHKEDIRSNLPAVYYRKANQAIPASKTTTEERSFSAAHFESKSQIDAVVAARGGMDRIAYNRWNQAQGHIQAHAIEHANLAIYGSPFASNLKTAGFFDILSTLNTAEPTSSQIVDGGGTGSDNASILRVQWGEQAIFGIYPAGTQAGLKRTDRSAGNTQVQIQTLDLNGNPGSFWGYEEQFEVDHGLVFKDYRQMSRIANISTSAEVGNLPNAADIIDMMITADYKIHDPENGQGVWYMNRLFEAILHKQALAKVSAGAGLTFDNYQGKKQLMFLGSPIRRSDALLNTEAQVTTTIL